MNEPDYQGFWNALPDAALCAGDWAVNEGFRSRYREEIVGVLNMLHRLGLVWGATALHPRPPGECDLCRRELAQCQMFVDGVTDDSGWAIMCPTCFFEHGLAIGPLTGQLYLQVEPGKWRLVVGTDMNGEDDTALSLPKPVRRGLASRVRGWFRSASKRPVTADPVQPQPSRPMRCGTPHLMRGGKIVPESVTSGRAA